MSSGSSGASLSYAEALSALQSRGRFGVRLGLERTRALLARIGHPEREFRGALIAGTNGKGSVLALSAAALRAAGLRVGETPKPHLVTYRERLQIGGVPVGPEEFGRVVGEVLAVADAVARRHGEPTEFELLTAATFRWFAEAGIDLAVVEVGLGGRLDATHAWDGGVAVVTNVSLDHTDRLGTTVEAIAREKAAIVMRGDLAVTGATGAALTVVRRRASHVGVPLTEVAPAPLVGQDLEGIEVELPRLGRTRVGLLGRHQAHNVAVANATLDALEAAGLATVPEDARRRGFADARWPGRLEPIVYRGRHVLLDGAHNVAGAEALAVALEDLAGSLGSGMPTLVLAMMADKDVDGVIATLGAVDLLCGGRVICTAVGSGRALAAAELGARWELIAGVPSGGLEIIDDPRNALDCALESEGPVIVAGSLYLVGAVRAMLVDDPLLVPDPA